MKIQKKHLMSESRNYYFVGNSFYCSGDIDSSERMHAETRNLSYIVCHSLLIWGLFCRIA